VELGFASMSSQWIVQQQSCCLFGTHDSKMVSNMVVELIEDDLNWFLDELRHLDI
jgi:hypothetical protein